MALKDEVAQRIRDTRRRRGMTVQTLAELIGRSARWLGQVELGRVELSMTEVERLAERLRVDASFLVLGTGVPENGAKQAAAMRAVSPEFGRVLPRETRVGTQIGSTRFPWVVCGYGPYRADAIETHFHPAEPRYPLDIDEAVAELRDQSAEAQSRGEWHLRDFEGYKLLGFHVPQKLRQHDEPRLVLHFAPTTFYHALMSDHLLDEPLCIDGMAMTLRERFADPVDLHSRPVSEIATLWGIGLAVVTSDGRVLVSERRGRDGTAHVLVPAATTFPARTLDADDAGGPDHVRAAGRSLEEHLGVDLQPGELTWLSFGASTLLCEYALIGRVDTYHSLEQIEQRRSLGLAVESPRTRRLHAVEFIPRAVAEFCGNPELRFSGLALITLVHALMSEFGVARVEEAFGRTSVTLAKNLPAWLDAMSGGA